MSRVVAEVEHRLRQRPREARREVGVHVVVRGRVEAAAPRLLDQGEVGRGILGRAPLGRVVRDLDGAAGGAPQLQSLGDGGEDRLTLAAHVRGVDALVTRHHPAQREQLVGAREAAGRVHEAARHAVRTGAHAGVQEPLHARELALRHGALGEADDRQPQRAVADQRRDVDRVAAAAHRRQVLAEGAPVPGHAVQPPAVVRPVLDGVGAVLLGERRRRHAAVAGDVRGHALAHRRLGARVQQDGEIGVRVRIDEAGGDVATPGVDDAPAAQRPRRADRRDPVAADADVAEVPGVAAAVDDAGAGDDQVVDASCVAHLEDLVLVRRTACPRRRRGGARPGHR